jgi:hypothetical protein
MHGPDVFYFGQLVLGLREDGELLSDKTASDDATPAETVTSHRIKGLQTSELWRAELGQPGLH